MTKVLGPDVRRDAAEAFAAQLLTAAAAADVAQVVLAKVRGDDVGLLRDMTRTITLQRLPRRPARVVHHVLPPAGMTCTDAIELTIARARAGTRDRHTRLERHRAKCPGCRGIAERLRSAERAFSRVIEDAVVESVEVAPRWGAVPAPAPAAPEPRSQAIEPGRWIRDAAAGGEEQEATTPATGDPRRWVPSELLAADSAAEPAAQEPRPAAERWLAGAADDR